MSQAAVVHQVQAAMEPAEDRLGDADIPFSIAQLLQMPQWSQPRIGWVICRG